MLSRIHERELALPDFQRDFVWDARATEELIESIARSFPAGSLLFMPWRPDAFSPRAIQGAPELGEITPDKLILDGQQRLSSLYQACYGVGDYRYFVDLNPLFENDDIEEAVFYRHKNRCGPYQSVEQQAERLVLPLGVLFGDGGGGFHDWRDAILEHRPAEDADQRAALLEALKRVYKEYVKPIEDYRFPVVTLDQETSLEAVCSIFETLNRTGIRLAVFDLLAARFYAAGLDLRRKWEATVAQHGIIDDFEVNKYYVLQSVALRVRGSVKRGDVLRLSVDDIEGQWDAVVQGYRSALEMLRDECGVRTGKWLPYGYLLVPMAALWEEAIQVSGPSSAANRARLKQWFWCSGFSQTYDRAANSQAARDFGELRAWLAGGEPPTTVVEFEFDPTRLREITPKQQSVYKAMMALVLSHGASDFHHGHTLTPASIAEQSVDDHHIFPRAYLNPSDADQTVAAQLVDCILNRTLIDANTTQRIGKRPPSEYLTEVQGELESAGRGLFEQVLESHLLPTGNPSPLIQDDFAAFLDQREALIAAEMAIVTGVDIGAMGSDVDLASA
ncbi:MAG TPA: DUF262 domain-containing protein [Solirubrobacterales bacterium]